MPTILHRAARRMTGRLGVHGFGLILIAVIWSILGVAQLTGPAKPSPGLHLFHQHIPVVYAATLWLVAGLGCLGAAIDRDGPRRDGLALAFSVLPPAVWSFSHIWAWIVSIIPGEPGGSPRGWVAGALYACMVGLVWLAAAIPDERYPNT